MSMAYTIGLSENERYIICRVSGPLTAQATAAYTKEVDRISRERHIKRFLFDMREAPSMLSILDNYDYANSAMPEMELQRDVRSAVLAAPTDDSHDFAEVVMQNAGYNMRVFHDESAAVAWLEE